VRRAVKISPPPEKMPAFDHSLLATALLGVAVRANPVMGWLFTVSRGVRARSARAAWAALGTLALGHATWSLLVTSAHGAGLMVPFALGRSSHTDVQHWHGSTVPNESHSSYVAVEGLSGGDGGIAPRRCVASPEVRQECVILVSPAASRVLAAE
jgi:hypothetical protein